MKKNIVILLVLSLLSVPNVCFSELIEAGTIPENGGPVPVAANISTSDRIAAAPVETADLVSVAAETVIYLGDPIVVDGPGVVVDGNTATIIAGGTFSATGTLADGMINVNVTETVELILDTAIITHTSGPAIMVTEAPSVTVVLADGTSNALSDGADSTEKGTLFSNDPLIVSGNGALAITAIYKHGIVSDDDLTINGGNITIAAATDGLHANDAITVYGATINVTEANDGLESEGTLALENSVLTLAVADDGIISATPMTITSSTIDVTSGVDGIESKDNLLVNSETITVAVSDDGLAAANALTITGGTIDVISGVNGIKSEGTIVVDDGALTIEVSDDGLSAMNDVTINGGQIYVNAAGDAVDSNGTLNINGGVVVALGGNSPEGGLDCESCAPVINGGTVVATGGTNSIPADISTQHVVVMRSRPVGSSLYIERDDAAEVLIFKVSKDYQSMIFTSAAVLPNRTYTIYTEGSISGGTDFHGLYTGATYSGGFVWDTFTTDEVVTYAGKVGIYLPLLVKGVDISPPPTATPTPTPTITPTPTGETVIYLGNPIVVVGPGVVVDGNTATIIAGGTFRVVQSLADGMIVVDTSGEVELILDDMSLTHTTGPAIMVTNAALVTVVLADGTTNTLVDGATYTDPTAKGTVFSNDPLIFSGNGALTVTGNYKHCIASDDNLLIQNGIFTLAAVTDGFHANDDITVNGGTIHVTDAHDGFESEGTLTVEGGVFTLAPEDDGIVGQGNVTINGGTIDITTGTEGIESKDSLTINDGAITIMVSDDALNAATDVTINGGQLYLNATADAVDSNGTLNINGGVIVALGGNIPEGGFDCDNCQIAINGGIVVATGGANSMVSSASGQHVAVIGSRPVNTALHIERDDGDDTLTFKVSKAYQSMIFTSPVLLGNRTYTVYTGGTISGGTDFHGLYTGATYTGGSVWTTFTTNQVVTYVGGGGPPSPY
jgi:hypothetical protein